MEELKYSKKRLAPLIAKYNIDENSAVFNAIIALFNNQTDYQIWAIKLVYSNIAPVDLIKHIKEWADQNPTEIKNLIKKNLVNYKSREDIKQLLAETAGLTKMNIVKSVINQFNTKQRGILKETVFKNVKSVLDVDAVYKKWEKILIDFSKVSLSRKKKCIILASALCSISMLESHIKEAMKQSYDWNKEDMLGFLATQCPNSEVVYDKDNIVIVQVNSFRDSQKLCGGGRTTWCLTREEQFFNRYTAENNNARQYFFFDFSLQENHELAHVGFTYSPKQGINYAHSTKNCSMANGNRVMVDNRRWSIDDLLKHHNIPKACYAILAKLTLFEWTPESFIAWCDRQNSNSFRIIKSEDKRFVIELKDINFASCILKHTFIQPSNYNINGFRVFLFMDMNVSYNDDNSIIVARYRKDDYGICSFCKACTPYSTSQLLRDDFFVRLHKDFKVSELDFINCDDVDPAMLLHKYIDERNVTAAKEILKNFNDTININKTHRSVTLMDKAMFNNMPELVCDIVDHPKFDPSYTDGMNEPFCFGLIYAITGLTINGRGSEDEKTINTYNKILKNLILKHSPICIGKNNINFTLVHICAIFPFMNEILKLVLEENLIDVNLLDAFECTALTHAIRNNNIEAIKLLLKHGVNPLPIDFDTAKEYNVPLEDLIKVNKPSMDTVEKTAVEEDDEFSDIFAKVFQMKK